jgi:excisionase family DNA binding protein
MTALLKTHEACQILQVSRSWLYDACARGIVPHVRLGGPDGPLRFVAEDLERWIAEQRRGRDVARERLLGGTLAPTDQSAPARLASPGAWPTEE